MQGSPGLQGQPQHGGMPPQHMHSMQQPGQMHVQGIQPPTGNMFSNIRLNTNPAFGRNAFSGTATPTSRQMQYGHPGGPLQQQQQTTLMLQQQQQQHQHQHQQPQNAALVGGHGVNTMGGVGMFSNGNVQPPPQSQPLVQEAGVNSTTELHRLSEKVIKRIEDSMKEKDTLMGILKQHLTREQQEKQELEVVIQQFQRQVQLTDARIRALEQEKAQKASIPNTIMMPSKNSQPQVPPFFWVPSADYVQEFDVSGRYGEVVTKIRDFEDQGWVIPVSGSLRLQRGGIYKWSLQIMKKCPHRPQMQFGVHGLNHEKPWRLVTTSRCSRSKDDDPWQDRPGGDRLIDQGDIIHVIVDMRALTTPFGTFSFAVNDGPMELVFEDIPVTSPIMPVVSMGGDSSSIKLLTDQQSTQG